MSEGPGRAGPGAEQLRHSLSRRLPQCDRRAGGLGRGARRPPAARLRMYRGGGKGRGWAGKGWLGTCPLSLSAALPAGGARHEAQVGAAPRGPGPSARPRSPGSPRRDALGRGTAALSLGEGPAVLQLRGESQCSELRLFKLPIAEARSQLQALLFGMAGHVQSLERRLEGLQGVKAAGGWAALGTFGELSPSPQGAPGDPAAGCASLVVSPRWSWGNWPGALGSRGAAFCFPLAWPGSAPAPLGQETSRVGSEDSVFCLCAETQPCPHG